jgi:RNA polymerase sigma factor (sigma-70 family)
MSNNQLTQEIYDHWYSRIYGYFYRRLESQSDVREMTADTLTDFFTYQKEIENPKSFIFKIAENKLKSFIKNKSNKPFVADIDEVDETTASYSSHYFERSSALVDCAKNQLKPEQFSIVEMCVLCDFTAVRTAEELNLSSTNVRQILSRSLKKLREKCKQLWLNLQ